MKFIFTLSLIISVSITSAQWTWKKGPTGGMKFGKYGTLGVPGANNNPGGRMDATTWKDNQGNFWLFGGWGLAQTTDGVLNDLWKYTIATNQWTWVSGDSVVNMNAVYGTQGVAEPTNKPAGRAGMSGWCDAAGNFWLFGGGSGGNDLWNDLWKFDPVTNMWTWMKGSQLPHAPGSNGTINVPSLSNNPCSRLTSSCWTDASDNLYLFGGIGHFGSQVPAYFLNDVWRYSPLTNQWTWVNGTKFGSEGVYGIMGLPSPANMPSGRNGAPGAVSGDDFWLFGGSGIINASATGGYLNDLWKYSSSTNQWTWVRGDSLAYSVSVYGSQGVTSPLNKPGGRLWASAWVDPAGSFWMYGGIGRGADGSAKIVNDLWHYNTTTNLWTWANGDSAGSPPPVYGSLGVAGTTTTPGWRTRYGNWADESGNLWLFGGEGWTPSYKSDLWRYTPWGALPVTITGFNGIRKEQDVKLVWKVEQEINLDRYEIERSLNGRDYEKIGEEKAINANEYHFTDHLKGIAANKIFYRLKMLDIDTKHAYSKTIMIGITADGMIAISPNPATSYIKLQLSKSIRGKVDVNILDISGRPVAKETRKINADDIIISTARLSSGTYIVQINNDGYKYFGRFVVVN